AYWLCEYRVDSSPFNLFVNQANSYKDCNEDSKQQHCAQTKINDYLALLSARELTNENCCSREQQYKQHEVVEHAVAHRLPKSIARNAEYSFPAASTCCSCASHRGWRNDFRHIWFQQVV